MSGDAARGRRRASVARNASASYVFRFLYGLVVILLTPYLFRALGQAGFGTYSVIFTFTTVFALVELSFANGIAKILAELIGRGDAAELRATLRVSVGLGVVAGVLACALSVVIGFAAAGLAAEGDAGTFRIAMAAVGAVMLVRLPCVAYSGALTGYQRYDTLNLARLVAALGLAVGTVGAVELGAGLLGACLALAGYLLLEAALYAVALRRTDRALPLRPAVGTAARRRRVAGFGSYLLLADGVLFIGHRMQPVIIAGLRGAAAAAPFSAAVKLQTGLQSLVYPFVDLLLPMVSELQARGRLEDVARRLALATRAALQITLPVAVGIALFAEDVVEVWLGAGAPSVTADVVIILMVVQVVTLTATPATKVLVGLGRVRLTAALSSVEGLANLVLTLVMVAAYGTIGAAIPMLLTSVLIAPVMLPLAARATGIPTSRLLRDALVPAVASSVPSVVAMVLVAEVMSPGPVRMLAGLATGVGLALLVAARQVGGGGLRRIWADLRLRGRRVPLEEVAAS